MPEVVNMTVPYLYIFCQHSGDEQAKDWLKSCFTFNQCIFKLVPDDGFMQKPKHAAPFGQWQILSETVVLTNGTSFYLSIRVLQGLLVMLTVL